MLQLIDLCKKHGTELVCNQVSLTIQDGEFFSLLGPSGCGKTTLLRMISGLLSEDSGDIILNEQSLKHIPPHKRNVNTIFQNYALFPHLSVFDNVAFSLKMKNKPKNEIHQKVHEALNMVELKGLGERKPHELSGGQQQRVAIARAVISKPAVLLLDEPLAALDVKLRRQMQLSLKRLQKELKMTFIFVTHDQEEALTMADRIAVMNKGSVEQVGTPYAIYNNPKTRFVAEFIGQANFFKGQPRTNGEMVSLDFGQQQGVFASFDKTGGSMGPEIEIAVRPEKMKLRKNSVKNPSIGQINQMEGVIEEAVYSGAMLHYFVRLVMGQQVLVAEQSYHADQPYQKGETVQVTWPVEHSMVIAGSAS